ncbi:MAG: hypothetical protein LAT81_10885 [Oceanicaulis sp.]|nr:hypothetical protein [Oceanicaulis sp.]
MADTRLQSFARPAETSLADAGPAALPPSSAGRNDELLPFLNNFHDVFTATGVAILFAGIAVTNGYMVSLIEGADFQYALDAGLVGSLSITALAAWLVSLLLVGHMRRLLPGILLSVIFTITVGWLLIYLYVRVLIGEEGLGGLGALFDPQSVFAEDDNGARVLAPEDWRLRLFPVFAALAVTVPAFLYYRSFALPFAGALTGVGLAALASMAVLAADPHIFLVYNPVITLAFGLALFIAGLWYDGRDPERETRLSGTGFWLHLFAAPVLLSAVVTLVNVGWRWDEALMDAEALSGLRSAIATLIVILAFSLVSLLINRRALIVSGLVTAGIATWMLISELGLSGTPVLALTLLVLGAFVVVLSAAWNPLRAILLAPFPKTGPIARLFPPVTREG